MSAVLGHPSNVTTYGLKSYALASCALASTNQSSTQISNPKTSVAKVPPRPPPFTPVTSMSFVRTDVAVCSVSYDSLSPESVQDFELLRIPDGAFRYVQRNSDGRFFDVSYYNAALKKSIPLGRFVDDATAALAHAIARADDNFKGCRVMPYAAQHKIEEMYVSSTTRPAVIPETVSFAPSSSSGNSDAGHLIWDEGDEETFAQLYALLDSP